MTRRMFQAVRTLKRKEDNTIQDLRKLSGHN